MFHNEITGPQDHFILLQLTTMLQIHPSYLGFGMMFLRVMEK
jgi:hypothetical protein